jgi:hypothetical protein
MKSRRVSTISESEWLAELEADAQASRNPPPPGYFSFDAWCRLFDRGPSATKLRLTELTRLGLVERGVFRAPDASGRVTLRPFWKRLPKTKRTHTR